MRAFPTLSIALPFLICMTSVSLAQTPSAASREYNGPLRARPAESSNATDRIIVQWRSEVTGATAKDTATRQLAAKSGQPWRRRQSLTERLEVLQTDRRLALPVLRQLIDRLSTDPNVEHVSPDLRRRAHALSNDPLLPGQWYFLGVQPAALRSEQAWDVTTGSRGTVVAVLDTGVRFDHPDLLRASQSGKLLPGYDFVSGESSSSFITANDGDGRDADPSDPGDWVTTADQGQTGFDDCEVADSSWHGTRVAGLIGAITNNSSGLAGAGWSSWVLPVRVLGKCGGYDSDIIAAMRWSAGLAVGGVPANPYPAKIVNLSLGGDGACTPAYQSAVSDLTALGVLIIASAGNEGSVVGSPANCNGVLAVTGLRHVGTKVGFSNLGPAVGIGAPGGNCVNTGAGQPCLFSIIVPTNLGTTAPGNSAYTDQLNFNVGTSFSAPLAAGAAALMHSMNARLGSRALIARLQLGATPYPVNPDTGIPSCHVPIDATDLQTSECYCTTETCGAGMLNASGAVSQALRPAVALQVVSPVTPGQNVTIDGNASAAACNRSIASYAWSVVSSTGTPPALATTNQPDITVFAPASGAFTLRLTITDNQGAQDSADVTLTPTTSSTTTLPLVAGNACPTAISITQDQGGSTTPPAAAPSGGGGGGQLFGWELLALTLLSAARRAARTRLCNVLFDSDSDRDSPESPWRSLSPGGNSCHRR